MFKKIILLLFAAIMMVSIVSCKNTSTASTDKEATAEATEAVQAVVAASTVDNTLAEDEEALVSTYAGQFTQETYTDSDTGLSITYNLYLPEGYDASQSYPMVVFIADSSCAGSDATASLTQGRGALVWASEQWQSVYPTIVAVPTYPETILDDHGSYTTTEYVELTKRYIDYMCQTYAVDTDRVYGTGQSMGCMTTLILASEYPELYAACMFVDGQWDISTLKGLEDQTFVYFAAEDDTNAFNGLQEVMAMFDSDSVSYQYSQWDGTWSVDELSSAAGELFTEDENQYFISWLTGTIDASTGNSGAPSSSGSFGGSKSFAGPSIGSAPSGAMPSMSGGMNSSSYHMASFDYAYNCIAVMEWLFQQTK